MAPKFIWWQNMPLTDMKLILVDYFSNLVLSFTHFTEEIFRYSWPLNNTRLNYMGSLTHRLFSINTTGDLRPWVLCPRVQPTSNWKYYFHIPNRGFISMNHKYCFQSTVGWIRRCEGPTIVNFLKTQKLYSEFWLHGGQWPPNPWPLRSTVCIYTVEPQTPLGALNSMSYRHCIAFLKIQILSI